MGNAPQYILSCVRVIRVHLDVLPGVRPGDGGKYELYECCVRGDIYFQCGGVVCLWQDDLSGTDQGGQGVDGLCVYAKFGCGKIDIRALGTYI